jgi:hypothetical protein
MTIADLIQIAKQTTPLEWLACLALFAALFAALCLEALP